MKAESRTPRCEFVRDSKDLIRNQYECGSVVRKKKNINSGENES